MRYLYTNLFYHQTQNFFISNIETKVYRHLFNLVTITSESKTNDIKKKT